MFLLHYPRNAGNRLKIDITNLLLLLIEDYRGDRTTRPKASGYLIPITIDSHHVAHRSATIIKEHGSLDCCGYTEDSERGNSSEKRHGEELHVAKSILSEERNQVELVKTNQQ